MSNFDISNIYDEIEAYKITIANAKDELNKLEKLVEEYFKDEFDKSFRVKAEPFGSVKAEKDGFIVTYDVKKSVSWDQDILKQLYAKIKKTDDPQKYMKITIGVAETAYKGFSEKAKKAFDEARTVKPGTKKIQIKKKG